MYSVINSDFSMAKPTPMKNIALAFSGGGFRAAAYSLGCLSYLNRIQYEGKPLLHNVRYISSTSGGSITNLSYSTFLFEGKTFDEFYTFLDQQLTGEQLLADAIQTLDNPAFWKERPHKSRNFINAFSLVYDKMFAGKTFGVFSQSENPVHLEEICVNATEFSNGLPFRFQSQNGDKKRSGGKIGNRYIYFTPKGKTVADQLRLSDILACSSCFPSGFEPMLFPEDFTGPNLTKEALENAIAYEENEYTLSDYNRVDFLKNKNFEQKQFGIMDGGITDNQGIGSFLKADDRRKKADKFDLFISCDVSSYLMDGYTLPVYKNRWYNGFSLRSIGTLFFLLACVFPLLLVFINQWKPWHYIVGTLSGIFSAVVIGFMVSKMIKAVRKTSETGSWNTVFKKYSNVLYRLRFDVLKHMLLSRAKSVFILANDVYLKQIRRMYYDRLFTDKKYRDKVIQNTIYDLSRTKFNPDDVSIDPLYPSQKLIATAEKARTMSTTLWFDSRHQSEKVKESIIATGQFTTCYNLLQYLKKIKEMDKTPEIIELEALLKSDFDAFNANPFFMIAATATS